MIKSLSSPLPNPEPSSPSSVVPETEDTESGERPIPNALRSLAVANDIAIVAFGDEPRAWATDIYLRAGGRKDNCLSLIRENTEELNQFGDIAISLRHREIAFQTPTGGTGTRSVSFEDVLLNEDQAAYLLTEMRTPKAKAFKVQLVKMFGAWRNGKLASPQYDRLESLVTTILEASNASSKRLESMFDKFMGTVTALLPRPSPTVVPPPMGTTALEEMRKRRKIASGTPPKEEPKPTPTNFKAPEGYQRVYEIMRAKHVPLVLKQKQELGRCASSLMRAAGLEPAKVGSRYREENGTYRQANAYPRAVLEKAWQLCGFDQLEAK